MKDALTTEILAQEAERGSYEAAAGRAIRLIETFTNGKGTIRLADGSHVDVEIAYRTARNVQRLMREIRESDFKKLSKTLQKECASELDSIVIYTFNSLKYSERIVIGVDKNSPVFS